MSKENLLEELRRLRHAIEAENDNNPKKYYEHLLSVQRQHGKNLVRRKPAEALKQKNAV